MSSLSSWGFALALLAALAYAGVSLKQSYSIPGPTPEQVAQHAVHVANIKQDFAKGGVEVGTILTLRRGGYALVTHVPSKRLVYAEAFKSVDPSIGKMLIETDSSPWFGEIASIVRPTDRNYTEVREDMLPASGR